MNNNNLSSINEIVIPSLSDPQYASDLNAALHAIKDNFEVLANHSFIKGADGSSISITNMPTYADGELTEIGQLVKDSIEANYSEDELESLSYSIDGVEHTTTVFDNLYDENNYVCVIKNADESIASSMYYVFIDKRFANSNIGLLNVELFANIKDASCVMVYNSTTESFDVLRNAFPTIYYERGVGLCWKIHGNESQIPVQGIPGKDGQDSPLYIVKCTTRQNTQGSALFSAVVSEVFDGALGYVSVDNIDITECDDNSALILCPKSEGSSEFDFYFGSLTVRNDSLIAISDVGNGITTALGTEVFINAMKNISLIGANDTGGSSTIRGLFIPIEDTSNEEQKVHLISATAVTNEQGTTSAALNTDVIWTPVNDINDMTVDENNQLMVDKYLYLSIENYLTHFTVFDSSASNLYAPYIIPNDSLNEYFKEDGDLMNSLSNTNYILKYKLTKLVKNSDSMDLGFTTDGNESNPDPNPIGGAYYWNNTTGESTCNTDPAHLCYAVRECNNNVWKQTGEFTTDPLQVMPENFKDRLITEENNTTDAPGIYKWELVDIVNEFDVYDLYYTKKDDNTYSFPRYKLFNTIFTTTLSPSESDDIMWFNGVTIDPIYDENGAVSIVSHQFDDETHARFIVYGWQHCTKANGINGSKLFGFNKFVPVLNNCFNINNDTALNINYNVNITGDNNNYKKNLTVHGSVISDTVITDTLYTDKLDTVNTENDIVTTAGIKAGVSETFIVDKSGNVDCNDINANNLVASKVELTNNDNNTGIQSKITMQTNKSNDCITQILGNLKTEISPIATDDDEVESINISSNTNKHTFYRGEGGSMVTMTNKNIANLKIDKPSIRFTTNSNKQASITIGYDELSHRIYANNANDFAELTNEVFATNEYSITTTSKSETVEYIPGSSASASLSLNRPLQIISREDNHMSSPVKEASISCGPRLFTIPINIGNGIYGLVVNNNKFQKQDMPYKYVDYEKIDLHIRKHYDAFIGIHGQAVSLQGGKFTSYPVVNPASYFKLLYTIKYLDKDNKETDLLDGLYDTAEGNIIFEKSQLGYNEGARWTGYSPDNKQAISEGPMWQMWHLDIYTITIPSKVYNQIIDKIVNELSDFDKWGNKAPTIYVKVCASIYFGAQSKETPAGSRNTISNVMFKGIRYIRDLGNSTSTYNSSFYYTGLPGSNSLTPEGFMPSSGDVPSYNVTVQYNKAYTSGANSIPETIINSSGIVMKDINNVIAGIGYDASGTLGKYELFYKDGSAEMQRLSIGDILSACSAMSTSMITYGV